jgi:ABC-type sulfate transport system permease component
MINETIINETINKSIHSGITIPSVVLIYFSFLAVLPLVALAFKKRNTNWGTFWGIWTFTAIITGIILSFVIASPDVVGDLFIKLKSIFS